MSYEVEIKYVLNDTALMRRLCQSLAKMPPETHFETDTYLRHPARSFAQTDEALRVRQANSRIAVTYKGPKIDATTKTRVEIELELAPGQQVAKVLDLWRRIGFLPVREVRKQRELFVIPWHGRDVHLSLDHVDGLGDYVELELSSDPAELEQSRQILKSLAEKLDLQESERRSYLELLLQKYATSADAPEKAEDWSE